jgi:hypothetical protein
MIFLTVIGTFAPELHCCISISVTKTHFQHATTPTQKKVVYSRNAITPNDIFIHRTYLIPIAISISIASFQPACLRELLSVGSILWWRVCAWPVPISAFF